MDYYNIQVLARIAGVSAHTIRAWEKRYKALVPRRQENGRRIYNEQDVERLSLLVKLSNMGNSIGTIARLSDDDLKEMLGKMSQTSNVLPFQKKSDFDADDYLRPMMMAITVEKWDIFQHEIEKCLSTLSSNQLVLEVLNPLRRELKERTAEGLLTIAQKEMLEQLILWQLKQKSFQEISNSQGNCLFVLNGDCEAQLEGLMMAFLCEEKNISPVVLNGPMSNETILSLIKIKKPMMVMLEGSLSEDKDFLKKISTDLLLMVRGQLNAQKQFNWQRQGVEVVSSVPAFNIVLGRLIEQLSRGQSAVVA